MIAKLFEYFGWVGCASVVCWAGALVWAVAGWRRRARRHAHAFQALAAALIGAWLARVNSNAISAIETDRTEEMTAHQEAARRLRSEVETAQEEGKVSVRFAEDSPRQRRDTVGPKGALPEPQPEGISLDERTAQPAYRQMGKQAREARKRRDTETPGAAALKEERPVRRMKEADVLLANRLDRYNLLAARGVVWLLAAMILWDYFQRHNRVADSYFPLPVGGAWLDALCPKRYAVYLRPSAPRPLRTLLEMAVRKGESVLYFGEADPWPADRGLPVVSMGRWRLRAREKIVAGHSALPPEREFLWDSAWFGWYVVVVAGDESARKDCLEDWLRYLRERARTRAVARHTVNVAWEGGGLTNSALDEMIRLGREMNVRVIYAAPDPRAVSACAAFEEVV